MSQRFRGKDFGVNDVPVFRFCCKAAMVGQVLAQPFFWQHGSVTDVVSVNGRRIQNVEICHKQKSHPKVASCRGTRIRTWDPLLPKQVRYRAALRPEKNCPPKRAKTADRPGFEPGVRFTPYVGLANRWFQPLTHLSQTGRKCKTGFVVLPS